MSNNQYVWSLGERLTVASLVSVVFSYLVFLTLDIIFGWGLGWVALALILGAIVALAALTLMVTVWRWVWQATGRYQMNNR